jgi:hypothetical protein
MKKTFSIKARLLTFLLMIYSIALQAQGFSQLSNELVLKIKPIIGIGALLAFIAGIFYALQGEDGQGKAKWAFGAVAIALILYFGLNGMIAALQGLLGI